MATLQQLIEKAGQVAVLKAHPVGSYFITEEDRNPAEILGLGGVSTWVKLEGRVLLGASSAYPVGSEGGEAMHTLTVTEMPSHSHSLPPNHFAGCWGMGSVSAQGTLVTSDTWGTAKGYTKETFGAQGPNVSNQLFFDQAQVAMTANGGIEAHNNLQPYRSAYIWRRTS